MKKIISFLGALALLSMVACKDKAKDAAKITTVSALKDYSTTVSTKMKQATDHWKERKAKGDTLALPYKDLEAYLPEISGYTSQQGPRGSQINVPGAGGWSEAEQDYVNGDKKVAVDGRSFNVRLAPGAGAKLTIAMKRFANEPTLSFPWA